MDLIFGLSALPAWLTIHFFIKNSYEKRIDKSAIKAAIWFGLLSLPLAIVFSVLSEKLLGVSTGDRDLVFVDGVLQTKIAIDVLIAALSEEISKFVPLAIFIFKKPYFNSPTAALVIFAIAGFTFAVPETFLYSLGAGGILTAIMRFAMGLFLHASLTALLGFFLYRLKNRSIIPRTILLLVLIISAGLIHFAYNFGIYAYYTYPLFLALSSLASFGISMALFMTYYFSVKKSYAASLAVRPLPNYSQNPVNPPINRHQSVGNLATKETVNREH